MTQETDLKAQVMTIATNSMLPPNSPEKVAGVLWNIVDKMICKDNETAIQTMMNGQVTSLSDQLTALTLTVNGKATTTDLNALASSIATALGTKADASTVTAIAGDVAKKISLFSGGAQKTNPKIALFQGTVNASGNLIVYMTDSELIGGVALFTNVELKGIQPVAQDPVSPVAFGIPTVSGDKKTLTIPVNKAGTGVQILGINVLGTVVPALGTIVNVMVVGQ